MKNAGKTRTWLPRLEKHPVGSEDPRFPVAIVELGEGKYLRICNNGTHFVYECLTTPQDASFELVEGVL
jgi:hypothetical protein